MSEEEKDLAQGGANKLIAMGELSHIYYEMTREGMVYEVGFGGG